MTDAQKAAKKKADKEKAKTKEVKRENQQKEENKYEDGKATKDTNVDLSTFKKKDVVKWTKKQGGTRSVSSGGKITFGGSRLGSRMRLHRKKKNRSASTKD